MNLLTSFFAMPPFSIQQLPIRSSQSPLHEDPPSVAIEPTEEECLDKLEAVVREYRDELAGLQLVFVNASFVIAFFPLQVLFVGASTSCTPFLFPLLRCNGMKAIDTYIYFLY